jgi:hypothetical protein
MAKKRLTDVSAASVQSTVEMMRVLSVAISDDTPPASLSELLIRMLNGNQLHAENKARVVRIFQLLLFRHGYMAQLLVGGQIEAHRNALMDSLQAVGFELNEALRNYSVTPQVDWSLRIPLVFYTTLDPATETQQKDIESTAVMALIQLAERDQLSGVRFCECDKFFLARRIDQYHCSPACRVKAHHSSDEFKAKRRKADRERYRLHRDAKVKETTRRKNVTHKAR